MVDYCNENGHVLNGQKTQLLTSARKKIEININHDVVNSNATVSWNMMQTFQQLLTFVSLFGKQILGQH